MLIRVAVSDPLPVFRHGIAATLASAGIDTEQPDDLLSWVHTQHRTVVVLTLANAADWDLLDELRRTGDGVLVLAVVDGAETSSFVRALSAGAVAVLPRDVTPGMVLDAVRAVIRGASVVPVEVIRLLTPARSGSAGRPAGTARPPHPGTPVSEQERRWLRHLASGTTVGRLAEQERYSERMMFRLLRELYRRLGAHNRTEAIMRAHDRGLL